MTAKLIEDRHGDNVLIYIEGKSVWIDCKYEDNTHLQFRGIFYKKGALELAEHIKRLAEELPE